MSADERQTNECCHFDNMRCTHVSPHSATRTDICIRTTHTFTHIHTLTRPKSPKALMLSPYPYIPYIVGGARVFCCVVVSSLLWVGK